jgi:hypothetical protein
MSFVMGTPRRNRRAVAAAMALGLLLAGACAEEADAPDVARLAAGELEGWAPLDTYEHADVLEFDQVAAAPAPDGAVWFTRAGGDGAGLAVWTLSGGQEATESPVGTPDAVAIPVAVAADDTGWTAVAVARQAPNSGNTGLLVWRSDEGSGSDDGPAPRALPTADGVPGSITVGRSAGATLVGGVVDGAVATWVSDGNGWSASVADLDADEVISARVVGTGDGFVLAAVDRDGAGHLWRSADGRRWSALDTADAGIGEGLAAVGLLAAVGDEPAADVVVAWLAGDAGAEDVARDAERVEVDRVHGSSVTPYGPIDAEPGDDVERVDVNGATLRGDFLVVAGAAVGADGTVRPGLWAGTAEGWARSSQADLVDQPDVEFRTVGASGDGALYGVLAPRGHVDVQVWRSATPRA